MNKLIMMVGIPGSGKTRAAEQIAKKERAVLVSTDAVRLELFGDEAKRRKNPLVFQAVYARIGQAFAAGSDVVFDATNVDRDKRIAVLERFAPAIAECYYLNTPFDVCLQRNQARKRKLDASVLEKYRKNLHFPLHREGFSTVHLVHEPAAYGMTKEAFTALLQSEPAYDELFAALGKVSFFQQMKDFPQDNPHHQHTLCRHSYHVLEYVNTFYEEDDKLLLQIVALFHDVGKLYTKVFKEAKGHYSYYGHEYVSSQIAAHFLKELGFADAFVFQAVALIEMHMKIAYGGDEGASEIYHLAGADLLTKLYFFKEADHYGK
ncbi:AAA family ATPase [Brevibacillus agri]|uniref:AAA family ATPase n=1 Tax=Brevibacillus agri TaxID=51101 RepID=UPI0030F47EC8